MTRRAPPLVPLLAVLLASSTGAHALADDSCPAPPKAPTKEEALEGMKTAKDRGALWRISKDGLTSYLYGTVHIGRAEWLYPGPQLTAALRSTAVLALEVDVMAPGAREEMEAAMAGAPKIMLTGEDRKRLAALARAECLPPSALAVLHPVMQVMTVSTLIGRRDGMYPEFAQEMMLTGIAQGAGRPVISLESMTLQMSALIPGDAAKARAVFDSNLTELESRRAHATTRYVLDAWERGDLAAIDTIEEVCQCEPTADDRAFYLAINDGRNPGIARRIAEEHAKGRPLLAAVGIAHMTGDKALPKLLAELGFEVARVAY